MEGKMSLVTLLVMILTSNVVSQDALDHFGRQFIIPSKGFDSIQVSTFKQYNVSVRSKCPERLPDFNVSFGAPVTISITSGSGAISMEADADIVVLMNHVTPSFPTHVSSLNYLVMTVGDSKNVRSNLLSISGAVENEISSFNITFDPCLGNYSSPVCNERDYNFSDIISLKNCSRVSTYYKYVDLTGAKIYANNSVLVTINGPFSNYPLPPTSTWGKQFIIPRMPVFVWVSFMYIELKVMAKDPDTTVKLQCGSSINMSFFLENQGDFFTVSIDGVKDCVFISDHPILVLYYTKSQDLSYLEYLTFIFPTEQFISDYIFSPTQLCYAEREKALVVIINTYLVTGLRINGFKIPGNSEHDKIENTNFTRIIVNIGNELLVTLRHIQLNVVFGAYVVCNWYLLHDCMIPLGSRMAPIAEPCVASVGIPGDGLDNDCDGFIDEDICSSNTGEKDCATITKDYIPCFGYTDDYGVTWTSTFINETDHQPCGTGTAVSSNFCEAGEGFMGVWQGPDRFLCGDPELSKLTAMFSSSNNESLADLLYQVWNLTERLLDNHTFSAADIKTVVDGLNSAVTVLLSRSNISAPERDNFVGLLDTTLSPENDNSWKNLSKKTGINYASVIMTIVPKFVEAVWNNSPNGGIIYRQNIILESRRGIKNDVLFPTESDSFNNTATKAQLFLSKETIMNSSSGSIDYTAIYYRTLSQFMPYINGRYIGSDIVSFSLRERHNTTDFVPAVQIFFKHSDGSGTNSTCVFWLFNGSGDGRWSDTGCYAVYRNSSFTACRCNHLTNFAVLLSSVPFSQDDHIALTIITWPGCVVSIISLVLTLVLNLCLWRNLKSDKTKLLVSLCTVLILAYILLLAGLNQTNDKIVCTVIAVVLHFLFLWAIFLMAAEGVEVSMTILTAFAPKQSHAGKLIVFSSVTPAVIVLISAVSTKLNGYGTDKYCWLEFSNGLIYAFLVPCAVVVLVNIILAVLVVRKMFTTKAMMKKETKDKLIAGVRSIAVLSPVLGLTWLFGILAFHKDLIAFSYLFAIFNSFQGLLIFIFHGVMNVKIRQGVQRRWNRFKSEHDLDNGRKKDVSKTESTELKSLTGTSSKSSD